MSIYLGNQLIAPNHSNSANQDLSNLSSMGQNIIDGKADVDLTNVNDSGTSLGAGWAMPSSTYTALTVGASGSTYTAPANGWLAFAGTSNSNSYAYVQLGSSSGIYTRSSSYSSGTRSSCYLPAKKGDIVTINYANESSFSFVFIYAVGSESEAS